MASVPPPQGMNEVDYEAIEAAVTETVRGRWFLTEFARRNRLAETRQLLDAMSRIESAVAGGQVALPSADPSIRLLIQRIKEIAGQLGDVASEMREAGVEDHFVAAVDLQARAVSGMMRNASPTREALPTQATRLPTQATRLPGATSPARDVSPAGDVSLAGDAQPPLPLGQTTIPADATRVPAPMPRMPRADLPALLAVTPPAAAIDDPRLAALSGLDGMPLAKKLAMFS